MKKAMISLVLICIFIIIPIIYAQSVPSQFGGNLSKDIEAPSGLKVKLQKKSIRTEMPSSIAKDVTVKQFLQKRNDISPKPYHPKAIKSFFSRIYGSTRNLKFKDIDFKVGTDR